MTNTTRNDALARLTVAPIAAADARRIVNAKHYMQTFPQGAQVYFGVFDEGKVVGVAVFGYSSSTKAKVNRLLSLSTLAGGEIMLKREQYIEMQRLWISDAYGHNTESYCLARIMDAFKTHTDMRLVVTHAGGCKDDCGIVYQASAWLYFGSEPCDDFYRTDAGEYRSLVAALRYGRVDPKGKTRQQQGEEVFGPGEIVNAHRYLYAYPIHKGLRRRLTKATQPYPKQSAHFRFQQRWIS